MKIIGISGNPKKSGTVDKLVRQLMDQFECKDNDIISLRELNIRPCQACMGCVQTNRCVQNDDWASIEDRIKNADVLILGVPSMYGAAFGINALTHNFLERWFALRHGGVKTNIKKVILAVVSGENHGEVTVSNLKTFLNAYHGIEVVESVIARGTTPCYICGRGEECPLSAVQQRYGKGTKIVEGMVPELEQQESVMEKVSRVVEKL